MKWQSWLSPILSAALITVVSSLALALQPLNFGEQILVLKNGNVQRGKVERGVGGFTLYTPSGSRIVIASEQVDFVCSSIEEALSIKRRRVDEVDQATGNGIRERTVLFQWCLKQGLLNEAQSELNKLQLMKLSAAELNSLLRQLHSALARVPSETSTPLAAEPGEILQGEILIASLPGKETGGDRQLLVTPEVKPISFDEQVDVPVNFAANELERITKQLPVEGVSLFKRRVEPLLFRNCSNAGCHDPNKTRWPLMRGARGEGIPKRMSQQNLVKTLAFLGDGKEGNSALLTAAVTPHGGGAKPPMNRDSEQYKLLLTWVEFMAPSAKSAGVTQLDSPVFDSIRVPQTDSPPSNALPLNASDSDLMAVPANQLDVPKIPSLEPSQDNYVPIDPFDPEIFNRKVRGSAIEKEMEKSPSRKDSVGTGR